MDDTKAIKEFINYICEWVNHFHLKEGHTNFRQELRDSKISYIIADKGIEKRIERQLLRKYDLKSKVVYTLISSEYRYLDGEITIKLINDCYEDYKFVIKE